MPLGLPCLSALVDWKERLAERLPLYMVSSELVTCPTLPVSNNHKVDRKRLHEIYTQLPAA